MYQTILNATKDVSFLPPEGKYPGRLVALKDMPLTEAKPHPRIRLLFKLEVPNSGGITFMAGRNIPPNLSIGSDLYWFLKPWIGEKMTMIEEAGKSLGPCQRGGIGDCEAYRHQALSPSLRKCGVRGTVESSCGQDRDGVGAKVCAGST